jgi:hypothetical protein
MSETEALTLPVQSRGRAASERIAFIGAEMRYGSDGPASVAVLTETVLTKVIAGRLLFAGSPGAAVLHRRSEHHAVEVVVRCSADAYTAADQPEFDHVSILCGSIEYVSGTYDTVLALGGLARTVTSDGRCLDWMSALSALAALVAPGGSLVIAVENSFGLPRVNGLRIGPGGQTDAFAADHGRLLAEIRRNGLTAGTEFAAFPDALTPTLVIHRDFLENPACLDIAGMLVAASYAGVAPRPGASLTDPVQLARDVVTHRMAFALAPAWVVVAHRPASGDGPGDRAWAVPVVAVSGAGGVPTVIDSNGVAGPTNADPASGWRPTTTAPIGPLLSERLVAACGRHDLVEVRSLLRRYATWLNVSLDDAEPGAWCPPERVAGGINNVIDDGIEMRRFLPGAVGAAVGSRLLFLRAMIGFADRLQGSALEHPWPATLTPQRLAVRLAAMVGLQITDADLAEAAEPVAVDHPDDHAVSRTVIGPAGDLSIPRGYAEAVRVATAISRELAEAREQLSFLADTLADRDLQLQRRTGWSRIRRTARRPLRAVAQQVRHVTTRW